MRSAISLQAWAAAWMLTVALVAAGCASSDQRVPQTTGAEQAERTAAVPGDTMRAYTEAIPGTLVEFNMIPVPGGSVEVTTDEGARRAEVESFWMGRTEVTWDAYDVFMHGLDEEDDEAADAIARPSDPYVVPGQNFGHDGFPVMAVTRVAARQYAGWLSMMTGHTYRLPTEAEWAHACRLGLTDAPRDQLGEHAWYAGNAEERVHAVATREPNQLGLHDLRGNVAEWTLDGEEDPPFVRGGSYRDEASAAGCDARAEQVPAWNESDPQLPKSMWWLSDAPFVGFRLVREP